MPAAISSLPIDIQATKPTDTHLTIHLYVLDVVKLEHAVHELLHARTVSAELEYHGITCHEQTCQQ